MIPKHSSTVYADGKDCALRNASSRTLAPGEIDVWLKAPEVSHGDVRLQSSQAIAANAASQDLLMRVLSLYSGIPAKNLNVRRAPLGKPYLEGGPCFNLSHSAGATAIAVSGQDVGIDIENPHRKTSSRELALRFFSSLEIAFLSRCPESQVGRAFLRHWVSKEAITKLVGVGIYRGLRHVETNHAISPPAANYKGRRVCLAECGEEIGMMGSVASWHPANVNVFVIAGNSAIID